MTITIPPSHARHIGSKCITWHSVYCTLLAWHGTANVIDSCCMSQLVTSICVERAEDETSTREELFIADTSFSSAPQCMSPSDA